MSASLVGSEMCIRDRSTAPTSQSAAPRAPRPGGYTACSQTLRPRHCSSCLLYTSDAADDM
eukprot:1760880-Alexandrium_andersonii.AAC.1